MLEFKQNIIHYKIALTIYKHTERGFKFRNNAAYNINSISKNNKWVFPSDPRLDIKPPRRLHYCRTLIPCFYLSHFHLRPPLSSNLLLPLFQYPPFGRINRLTNGMFVPKDVVNWSLALWVKVFLTNRYQSVEV